MELQQSPLFAEFIRRLHWKVLSVDGTNIFVRKFPLVGTMAKIQRPTDLPKLNTLIPLLKSHRVRTIVAEARHDQDQEEFKTWARVLKKEFSLTASPYLPTKTILVDLTPSQQDIFNRFTSAKRRAVRRAEKYGVTIRESHDINELVRIKNKSAGLFGFVTTFGIAKIWPIFAPEHAAILLAYVPKRQAFTKIVREELIGGVLLLFWEDTAFYWIAGATRLGKHTFAPTLLAWECMKLAKKRGAKMFDFVGVWDARLSKEFDSWKGFTKFKEGFGGIERTYPLWFT